MKKFKVKITLVAIVEEDQESFEMLQEAAEEGDMQMINETISDDYREITVEKVK